MSVLLPRVESSHPPTVVIMPKPVIYPPPIPFVLPPPIWCLVTSVFLPLLFPTVLDSPPRRNRTYLFPPKEEVSEMLTKSLNNSIEFLRKRMTRLNYWRDNSMILMKVLREQEEEDPVKTMSLNWSSNSNTWILNLPNPDRMKLDSAPWFRTTKTKSINWQMLTWSSPNNWRKSVNKTNTSFLNFKVKTLMAESEKFNLSMLTNSTSSTLN